MPDDVQQEVRNRYPALDLESLLRKERTAREWAVNNFCPAGAAIAVVGPAGSGKSMLIFAMMLYVVAGRGRFAGLLIPRARRVLYIDTENTEDDIQERIIDLGITTITDLSMMHFIHLPALPPLDREDGGRELAAIVRAYGLVRGDIVVLDSTQRVTQGPENDSDTWRNYYRHTGQGMKRAGLTVIRTDNTGKDASRGGRGSSGKRDDVDVSWILSAAGERGQYLTLHPEKQRIPDVHDITLERITRLDGTIGYSTAGDPRQKEITTVVGLLDELAVHPDSGVRASGDALRLVGHRVSNDILRDAVRARKSVPNRLGTPPGTERAKPAPAHHGTPNPEDLKPQVTPHERRAG